MFTVIRTHCHSHGVPRCGRIPNPSAERAIPVKSNTSLPSEMSATVEVVIYVAEHCLSCDYSYEVAEDIRRDFPQVAVRIINMAKTEEEIPEAVFATPTYLLNGKLWSLGNPSPTQVVDTLSGVIAAARS